LADKDFCDACTNLLLKLAMITFIIDENLGAGDACDSSDVVIIFSYQSNVALLEITLLVVDDELDVLIYCIIEDLLNLFNVAGCATGYIFSNGLTAGIEVGIEIIKTVKLPWEFTVLNAVLSKVSLKSIIELGVGS
jgi:hypothetical protein